MIEIKQKGNLSKTEKFLRKAFGRDYLTVLDKYGQYGVSTI